MIEFNPGDVTFMWKDANSNTGECPGLSKVPGGYLVQGIPAGPRTLATLADQCHLGEGEVAVFVPDNVLDRLRAATE